MIYKLADNILSPLGETTEQNFEAVLNGESALKSFSGKWNLPEPFCASLLSTKQNEQIKKLELTHFESMVLFSVRQALSQTKVEVANKKTVFILSTTKGNVELLEDSELDIQYELPGNSARKIVTLLGMTTSPIVVCNACISGVSAIILASRLLEMGTYEHAIICGADSLGRFIVSGFQSLKALSPTPCRPFDMERNGLNLGEAAATIILGKNPPTDLKNSWCVGCGAIRNDSHHISTPSKNGDGAYLALKDVTENIAKDELAFINAHGTATMFNDQMESVAIEKAELQSIPVNAYKSYYGHTLGAAGVLETVLSMKALDHGVILGTKGYEELGVSGKVCLSQSNQHTHKNSFVKMISGFGGCNAALLLSKEKSQPPTPKYKTTIVSHKVIITPTEIQVDEKHLTIESHGASLITDIYKRYIGNYPKYYKMDMLCRLGFVASELLLKTEKDIDQEISNNRAIILFNRTSSLVSDLRYQESIKDANDFYPSPSIFVYTLPNIVTGEIALRNHYHGETSFYILPERDDNQMNNIIRTSFLDTSTSSVLSGWLDYQDEDNFIADFKLIDFLTE